jgi:hypothetical protein
MIVSLCIRQKKNGTWPNGPFPRRHTKLLTTTTNFTTSWAADTEDQAILLHYQNLAVIALDIPARPKVPEHISGHVHLPHQWLNPTNSKSYEGTTAITGARA